VIDWPSLFDAISKSLPPYFFGTLMSAAFGAFAGAWINSRIQTTKSIVTELNNIRAALILCFSISNRFVALKRQHVRAMRDRYVQADQEHDEFLKTRAQRRGIFTLIVDLQTIAPVIVPIAALERHVFEKISLHGRGLAAANDLISAIDAFDKSIKYRNDLLDEMRERRLSDDNARAAWYFGLMTENGIIDARYKMNVQAIYNQADDCIFFSQTLAADLLTYGNKLRKKGRRGFRFGIPRATKCRLVRGETGWINSA